MRTVIVYKNFAANKGISHIGLGVTAQTNAEMLRRQRFWVDVWPIVSFVDLVDRLEKANRRAIERDEVPISHVIISAPWIESRDLAKLVHGYTEIDFAVCSHSNVGFLQADPNGVRLLKEGLELQLGSSNFHVAGNSRKFCSWIERAYLRPIIYLPNLYAVRGDAPSRHKWSGGTLRIGAFGAVRPLKNLMTAAAAALEVSNRLSADVELHISGGRAEGGGETVMRSVREMLSGVRNVKLVENNWQSWPAFRQLVRHMHLLLQVSYTESFNNVTADGIAEGVASVVSDAIDWVPERWKAASDDVNKVADVALSLIGDSWAAKDGMKALDVHNALGIVAWSDYLLKRGH